MIRNNIKQNTKDIHKYVENLPIMKKIINKTIIPELYLTYLNQLLYIYKAIENNKFFFTLNCDISLYDKCKLDIDNIKKNFKLNNDNVLEITKIYCNYLENINDFNIFIAHFYVRYMADLMGGSIIKKKLQDLFPTNVYNIDKKYISNIDIIINNNINNKQLFYSEVHHSFSMYSVILTTLV